MNFKDKVSVLFTKQEYAKLVFIFFGIVVMGLLEVIGVTAIVPFIAVVTSPEIVNENIYLANIYSYLNFQTTQSFLVFLGFCLLSAIFISNCFQAFMIWVMTYFTNLQYHRVQVRLLDHYLKQPYYFFLDKNSSELVKNIMIETSRGTSGVVLSSLQVLSKIVVAFFLFILIIIVDYEIALTVLFAIGCAYFIIYKLIKKRLTIIGESVTEQNFKLYKTANEALSGIKDIKIYGDHKAFIDQFFTPSKNLANYGSQTTLFSVLPRYFLEIIAFGGIIIIIVFLLSTNNSSNNASIIPILSLYVMIGYRLLPAIQQIYGGIVKIKYNIPGFEFTVNEFLRNSNQEVEKTYKNSIEFTDKLEIIDLSFNYDNYSINVLNKANLSIKHNTTVGIVGLTGSGKTTLIDVLLGLLEPKTGLILVDGVKINRQNISSWQSNIGYVPQSIYLIDNTIEANIAFPRSKDGIDIDKIIKAAKLSNLHNFIMTLPDKYKTVVGERGVRLSGGQCQRIGIARALYDEPSVLILDEATSSLDGLTESAIMEAINTLSHKKTIIMIAHRLSTVQECDNIYLMGHGNIIDSGKYKDLILNNEEFQKMAKGPNFQ